MKEFNIPRTRQHKLYPYQFSRVINHFMKTGAVQNKVHKVSPVKITTDVNTERVKKYFEENCHASIMEASISLEISFSCVYRFLRKKLHSKPFRSHKVQTLTEMHMTQRLHFCQWWQQQPDQFSQKVLWSDEKWFVKKTAPNRQNERCWALVHPHEYVEHQQQGGEKMMAWVGIVDGEILPVYWFRDAHGNAVSVQGESYPRMFNEHVYPCIKTKDIWRRWWFQQDGATPHCTNANIEMLNDKFKGRVISRRAEVVWPSCSPDLNPLDYWFWGYCMNKISREKPETMQEVCEIVERMCRDTPEDMIRRSVDISARVQLCMANNGGHFQNSM